MRRWRLPIVLAVVVGLWALTLFVLLVSAAEPQLFWTDFALAPFAAVFLAAGGLFWRDGAKRLGWGLVAFGSVIAALSAALHMSITVDLYRMRRILAYAEAHCAGWEGRPYELVCGAGYRCDETSRYQVSCGARRGDGSAEAQVFLPVGFDIYRVVRSEDEPARP